MPSGDGPQLVEPGAPSAIPIHPTSAIWGRRTPGPHMGVSIDGEEFDLPYLWVEHRDRWWPTIGGRWIVCPKHDRPLTHREFMYGAVGLCGWCRPDLLPPVVRKRTYKKKG